MATIPARNDITMMKINSFLGLNENPDGDTTLKTGEMAEMRNFRITMDNHLQIRPGTKTVIALYAALEALLGEDTPAQETTRIRGVWLGTAGSRDHMLAAYGGYVWDIDTENETATNKGAVQDYDTHFFGFEGSVYLLNGHEYKVWDGGDNTTFEDVDGYVPLVQTATTPAGEGTLLENINRLTGKRRVMFSPDGEATVFVLPESPITDVNSVKMNGVPMVTVSGAVTTVSGGSVTVSSEPTCIGRLRALGGGRAGEYVLTYSDANKWSITIGGQTHTGYTNLSGVFGLTLTGTPADGDTITITVEASWTADLTYGTVTFDSAPTAGTNTIEIEYENGDGDRAEVLGMRFSELFNGSTDSRVFLYGNGTNRCIYSGIPFGTGQPSAEYFPQLYEIAVGEKNTPITALVRHYSRLMAFKPNSAWVIQYGTLTLESSQTTAAFYVQPVNRQFGNEALGQVKLLENNPLTLDVGSVYQWKGSSYGYVTSSESNAKRISDRVTETLRTFDFKSIKTFNIKMDHEFWIISGSSAIILNYANNTWYVYRDLTFRMLLETEALERFGFGDDGRVVKISREFRSDDGEPIDCYAATGAMDFKRDWLLKYSPMIFVAMQPESNSRIYVTAESNRRSDYPDKLVAYSLSTFEHLDFNHMSFGTNRKPQVKRVKLKVKKATYYRLVFKSNSASATATVIETDIRLRYAGNVK